MDTLTCTCGESRIDARPAWAVAGGRAIVRTEGPCAGCGASRQHELVPPADIADRLAPFGDRVFDVGFIAAAAPFVASAFPSLTSPREARHFPVDASPIPAPPGWRPIEWLRGSTAYGQAVAATAGGKRALVSYSLRQTVSDAELAAALDLQLEGIVPLLDIGRHDEGALILEAEPVGIPLSTPMLPLPASQALRVFTEVLVVLERARAKSRVVRGIRPETVYLTNGADGLALSAIAPRIEKLQDSVVPHALGTMIFPYDGVFDPVEVSLRMSPASASSDVFAACATLVYAMLRRSAFEVPTDDVGGMIMAAGRGAVALPELPSTLRELVERALGADVAARPTATELLRALNA